MRKTLLITCSILAILFGYIHKATAQSIVGTWYNEEKTSKIQIYEAKDDRFYGKIVWLKEPNENGSPRVDKLNPDKTKKKDAILNLIILKRFKSKGNNKFDGGTVYDPKSGKIYSGTITLKGDKLDLRGYVGISAFGRTSTWTRAQ